MDLAAASIDELKEELQRRFQIQREERERARKLAPPNGRLVLALRNALGKSQGEFADLYGVSQSLICQIEHGKKPGAAAKLLRLLEPKYGGIIKELGKQ